ncbi:MAG: 1-acyl-sn-glycerol-3-phosphate acyltransferase [Deltaproteobacteria bacterium]|jgi:1-acyl-sn-glycerol-3-phosphate acyltransferase|nr:1-acyl-sn-glycerol-3-phosphate acyltransferase [Deltaproteobacteria bacterium]
MRLLALSAPTPRPPSAAFERAAATFLRTTRLLSAHRPGDDFGVLAQKLLSLHRVALEVRGPRPSGPAVIVANHLGYLDPMLIRSVLPVVSIAKAELSRWPYLGRFLAGPEVIFVDRSKPHSGALALRRATRALEAGRSVVNFPEGTTTTGDRILAFRRGIFGVARSLGIPVVPVSIELPREVSWVGAQGFLPHYLNFAGRAETVARLQFSEALDPDGEPDQLAERARQVIAAMRGGR